MPRTRKTTAKPKRARGRKLTTLLDTKRALVALVRGLESGAITPATGRVQVQALKALGNMIQALDLEKRVEALEHAAEARGLQ